MVEGLALISKALKCMVEGLAPIAAALVSMLEGFESIFPAAETTPSQLTVNGGAGGTHRGLGVLVRTPVPLRESANSTEASMSVRGWWMVAMCSLALGCGGSDVRDVGPDSSHDREGDGDASRSNCIPSSDSCMSGERCAPLGNDGQRYRCTTSPGTLQLGDACVIEGSFGFSACGDGLRCLRAPGSMEGRCAADCWGIGVCDASQRCLWGGCVPAAMCDLVTQAPCEAPDVCTMWNEESICLPPASSP